MPRLTIRSRARADIKEIVAYIKKDSPRSARVFAFAVEKLCRRLVVRPELGAPYDSEREFDGLRVVSIPRFRKYLVFYRIEDKEIDVVRVVHGARDLPNVLESDL